MDRIILVAGIVFVLWMVTGTIGAFILRRKYWYDHQDEDEDLAEYLFQGAKLGPIIFFTAVFSLFSDDPRDRVSLGAAYKQRGQVDRAIGEYQRALQIDPYNVDAHFNLGNAYGRQGRWNEAASEYQTVLQLAPNDADAHSGLGIVYTQLERFDEAISEFKSALQIDPNLAEAHYNLSRVYFQKDQLENAIRESQIASELGFQPAHKLLNDLKRYKDNL